MSVCLGFFNCASSERKESLDSNERSCLSSIARGLDSIKAIFSGATLQPEQEQMQSPLLSSVSILDDASPDIEESISQPIFSVEDDIFNDRCLRVSGDAIYIDQVEEKIKRSLEKFNLKEEQIHRSQLVHGANSSSLIAFTNYNQSKGALIPLGDLEKSGKIPFCGEVVDGRNKVNEGSLSTAWVGELKGALRYSYQKGNWTPEVGKRKIESGIEILREDGSAFDEPDETVDLIDPNIRGLCRESLKLAFETGNFQDFKKHLESYLEIVRRECFASYAGTFIIRAVNSIEVNQKRLLEWEKLDQEERNLVSDPFPVLYGIKSSRKGVHHAVYGVHGEIGLKGGAEPGEIKVIFVPADKTAFVQDLLARNGHFIPVEEIPDKKYL